MLKSIQTIEKCVLVQTGFQEHFHDNLKGIITGIQVLIGLMSQNFNMV